MGEASPKHGGGKKFVGVLIDDELLDKLRARAERQDRTVSATIRVLLRMALSE